MALCFCLSLCHISVLASSYRVEDLTELSLEELLDIDVSLGVRRGETLRETPAAAYVLNREAINRSGATSIPELLRLVPGVEVARFGSGKWGVGIRGFNGGIFTNRLLILVDGRSVFSPAKIGMFWDTLDTFLPDIERIEVVRGPGTALWGANAFNGVINIVTRHAADTSGGLAELGGGNEEQLLAGLRYGWSLGEERYLRTYVKTFERDDASHPDGYGNRDHWDGLQTGLRYDQGNLDVGKLSVQLIAYDGTQGEVLLLPDLDSPNLQRLFFTDVEYSGVSFLSHWKKGTAHSSYSLKFYADRSERIDSLFDLTVDSYDIDYQQDYRHNELHKFIWGVSYRYTEDKLPARYIRFTRDSRSYDVVSGFAQYEFSPSEEWRFIAGAKLEESEFGGREVQPNIRALWSYSESGTLWFAVSEAKRMPSRTEHDVRIDFDLLNPNVQLQLQGSEDFKSEGLRAWEFGWRRRAGTSLNLDLAFFYNEYEGLRTLEPSAPEPNPDAPPAFIVPLVASNGSDARSWGGELVLNAVLGPRWNTELQYSHVQITVDANGSGDPNVKNPEGESPKHRATLRSNWDLPGGWEVSAALRYVDDVDRQDIDEYTELDFQLSKAIGKHATLSLVGQNLLDKAHEEYIDRVVGTPPAEVERSAYLKLRLNF